MMLLGLAAMIYVLWKILIWCMEEDEGDGRWRGESVLISPFKLLMSLGICMNWENVDD